MSLGMLQDSRTSIYSDVHAAKALCCACNAVLFLAVCVEAVRNKHNVASAASKRQN